MASNSRLQGLEVGRLLSDYKKRNIVESVPSRPLLGHPRGSELFCSIVWETDLRFDRMHYISLLLDLGWDPTVKNQGGQTALHMLAKHPCVDFNRWVDFLPSFSH